MFRLKLLCLVWLVAMVGCGDEITVNPVIINEHEHEQDTTKTPGPDVDTMKVVSMRINPQVATLKVGDTLTFSPICSNMYGNTVPCSTVSWRSNNNSIAEMLGGGKVLAKSTGTTTVCGAVSSTIDSCAVVIVESAAPAFTIYGVFTSPTQFTLTCGQFQQMSATVVGNGTVPQTVTWSSSDTTVARVSSSGLVTGVRGGSALVRAVSTVDATKASSSYVSVNSCTAQSDTTITLLPEGGAEFPLNSSFQTTAVCRVGGVITPCNKPWWFSRAPDKIAVDPWTGKLTALKVGTVEICVQVAQRQGAPSSCRFFTSK